MGVARSQNGWRVNPARRARMIPGTGVRVTVADGPAGVVLLYVLGRIDAEVEDIDLRSTRGEFDDWGYAERNVRGSSDISNHASATAVDVNATRHPLGVKHTFTAAQVAQIHQILDEVDNVVRWGGDYDGRVDEMHFEINDDDAAVARVAARLSTQEDDMQQTEKLKDAGPGSISHNLLNTNQVLNNKVFGLAALGAQLRALTAAVAADKDITPADLEQLLGRVVAEHMPTAQDVATAQHAFLEDLVRDVVPELVGDEQADRIIDALAEKLGATTEGN